MCVYSLINMDADKSIYKSINQSRGKHNKKGHIMQVYV